MFRLVRISTGRHCQLLFRVLAASPAAIAYYSQILFNFCDAFAGPSIGFAAHMLSCRGFRKGADKVVRRVWH